MKTSESNHTGSINAHRYRPDIQGMRTVAVLTVLVFHLNSTWVPGGFTGVDMFFVISGYLITGLLIKEKVRTGKIDLIGFYGRRIKRILPAASIVIAATLLGGYLIMPAAQWGDLSKMAIASSLSVANWFLAFGNTDYFAAEDSPSPFQHYWSLGVEEQYYMVWPVLLIAVFAIVATRKAMTEKTTAIAVLVMAMIAGIPSLVHSIILTANNPQTAYFATTTRVWELAVGAALSAVVVIFKIRMNAMLAWFATFVGVGLIAYGLIMYTGNMAYPSFSAAAPVFGIALLILAGTQEGSHTKWLELKPMRTIGDASYSLYLIHWPVIVLAGWYFEDLTVWHQIALGILAVSLSLASYKWVESPTMHMKFNTPVLAGSLAAVTAVLVSLSFAVSHHGQHIVNAQSEASKSVEVKTLAAGRDPFNDLMKGMAYKPSASEAREDTTTLYNEKCQNGASRETVKVCHYGDEDSKTTIVLFGDSHASHWSSALIPASEKHGWHFVSMVKSNCPAPDATVVFSGSSKRENPDYVECDSWTKDAMRKIEEIKPDIVLHSFDGYTMSDGTEFSDAIEGTWKKINDMGIRVGVIMDTPQAHMSIPVCLQRNDDPRECATPKADALEGSGISTQTEALDNYDGDVHRIETIDLICPGDICSPIIGNAVIYTDTSHLSQTFGKTLTDVMGERVKAVLESK